MENQTDQRRALNYKAFCNVAIQDIKNIETALLTRNKEKTPEYFGDLLTHYHFYVIERCKAALKFLLGLDETVINSEADIQNLLEGYPDILQIHKEYTQAVCTLVLIHMEETSSDNQHLSISELITQLAKKKGIEHGLQKQLNLIKGYKDFSTGTIANIQRALTYQKFWEETIQAIESIGKILLRIHKEETQNYFANLLVEYYCWAVERHKEELRLLLKLDETVINSEADIQKLLGNYPDILQIQGEYIANAICVIKKNVYGKAASNDNQYQSLSELLAQIAKEKSIGHIMHRKLKLIRQHKDLCRDTIAEIKKVIDKYKEREIQALFSELLGILNQHDNTFFHIVTQMERDLENGSKEQFDTFAEKHRWMFQSELKYICEANTTIYEAICGESIPDKEKDTDVLYLLAELATQKGLEGHLLQEADRRQISRTDLNRPEKRAHKSSYLSSLRLFRSRIPIELQRRPDGVFRRKTAPS